jgi:hypothetical protein
VLAHALGLLLNVLKELSALAALLAQSFAGCLRSVGLKAHAH